MDLDGRVTIDVERQAVWDFLTDPDQVRGCAPGLESLEVVVPGEHFHCVASAGLGSVKARFTADVHWEDLEPPRRARMRTHGTAPATAWTPLRRWSSIQLRRGAPI